MEVARKKPQQSNRSYNTYLNSILTLKVFMPISHIGSNIETNLKQLIAYKIEGRCIDEGFVKQNSIRIVTYSSGKVNGDLIEFHVTFECMICHPIEGMIVNCRIKMVSKAGIHAEVIDEDENIPIVVFIARDHNMVDSKYKEAKDNFENLKKNEYLHIRARIIGIRFELNDPNICAIGHIMQDKDK
jgi:DNA-directed RNA polymerase subunit E'/Rpb7